ncbi:SGNH/GDSL hydrolase family protein [Micromonospora rosaria]|uniref:SGNH/GDSL hydrolase family protein n=1 Tax=Micromonospora rosaria TaxID=47874 RepID=UPI000A050493|nr:SGNH/GDSL hydrolase family protein [Micromonospora rosaria]
MRSSALLAALTCAAVLLSPSTLPVAAAAATPPHDSVPPAAGSGPAGAAGGRPPTHPDRVTEPDARLGPAWRGSTDRAVTTSSDASGLHLLVADEAQAYAWRTAATLAEPGFDTDQWIGQACLTGSGRRAVVVYGPRTFTNRESLLQRGGFAAVVDLTTGAVTKLRERVSLAYHNPGCGAGERAVLSRLEAPAGPTGPARTWLGTVDAARPTAPVRVRRTPGQVTSVLPVRDRLIGARGDQLVSIDRAGGPRPLAELAGTPFRLLADGRDAVAFQVVRGERTEFKRFAAGRVAGHGSAPRGEVALRPGAGGRVFVVGSRAGSRTAGHLPSGWRAVDGRPDSDVSTTGALVVSRASTGREAAGRPADRPVPGRAEPVEITSRRVATDARLTFSVVPRPAAAGRAPSPALTARAAPGFGGPGSRSARPPADPDVPHDPDRSCSVPRNDPASQVYQPTVAQVEWAADLAVRGMLTFQRPANWNNKGMAAYSPQGLFPLTALSGGGTVPAQIFLGILAQESNLWQASPHVVDASVGNPLISLGYYGLDLAEPDFDDIDWEHTDCGYGAAQVTSGMKRTDVDTTVAGIAWTYPKQQAVALDYAANLAAGLRILQDKWNTTRDAGLVVNDGDPRYLENWWFAIWAYNTGFYPRAAGQPWGVGWANNPANPDYPADRRMFLTEPLDVYDSQGRRIVDDDTGYDNAKHPNHWSYPERVIGFAYTSLIRFDYRSGSYRPTYRPALSPLAPALAQPGRYTFCAPAVNDCGEHLPPHAPGDYPGTPAGACQRDDLRCWWHAPVTWTSCPGRCGTENRAYTSVEPRPYTQPGDNIHPTPAHADGSCAVSGLPAGARIIDDIATTVPLGAEGCTPTFTRGGTFALNFATHTRPDGTVVTPGKVDFHQIGAGFGGHFWFAHTHRQQQQPTLRVTGTWRIDPTHAWTRVWVHLPDHGAHTRQARYVIRRPDGGTEHRTIPTQWEENRWVSLGVFDFTGPGTPRVELTNFTLDGRGVQDIAWDALAVQPLPRKPAHFVVALGDSYSSGEGAGDYTRVSNQYGDDEQWRNSCRRSPHAWSQRATIPGAPASIGTLSAQHHPDLDAQFLACSGARTVNLLSPSLLPDGRWQGSPAEGQYGEVSQLDQGSLTANTTAVLLSIGGNDARFAQVGLSCATGLECGAPGYVMAGDDEPLRDRQQDLITGAVRASVQKVVEQIRLRAPAARIFVMGYPRLFDTPCRYFGQYGMAFGFTEGETEFLNELSDLMAGSAVPSDPARGVHGMDARGEYTEHGICGASEQYLHGVVAGDLFGDDDGHPRQPVGMETLHPNRAGNDAYARVVQRRMDEVGYRW